MPDPFLRAHAVSQLVFDISSGVVPRSIRDQIVRAVTVVNRAVESGYIAPPPAGAAAADRPGRQLLVVGGGVAGMTAGVRAAQLGVRACVIEQTDSAFHLQAGSGRWVDPTVYDWPVAHWVNGRYPWRPPAVPFDFAEGHASVAAGGWERALTEHRRTFFGLLEVRTSDVVTDYLELSPAENREPLVRVKTAQRPDWQQYGMVVFARGHGREQTSVGNFRGYQFWDPDPYAGKNAGVAGDAKSRVVISGSGDGSLQDLLRLTCTQPSARALLEVLQVPEAVCEEVRRAEDWAGRSICWGAGSQHDHAVLRELHLAHRSAVTRYLSTKKGVRRANNILLPTKVRPVVQLVHSCDHFSGCYPANRFLTLLVADLLGRDVERANGGVPPIVERSRVLDVSPDDDHACGDPDACHGRPHVALLAAHDDCRDPRDPNAQVVGNMTCQAMIVRHGPAPGPDGVHTDVQRQVLPYHVPVQ
jgi:hypothetical protein